jgi:hypothetical protein
MGKGGGGQRVVYYFMSSHWGVCWGPVDELRSIYVGEKVAFDGFVLTEQNIDIHEPELFGGESSEGGISTRVRYYPGNSTQTLTDNHAARIDPTLTGATMPGYRGLTSLFFQENPTSPAGEEHDGAYVGANNPYLKPIWVRIGRQANAPALTDSYARIYRGNRTKRSIYFAIDHSASMDTIVDGGSTTRLDIMQSAMDGVFDRLAAEVAAGIQLDVGLGKFNTSLAYENLKLNADVDDIEELRYVLGLLSAELDTDYEVAATAAHNWFTDSLADETIGTRIFIFITDGEPSVGTGASAAAIFADELSPTGGLFNTEDGTDVQSYAINIDLSDTTESGELDNTPQDGVPVVSEADATGLQAAIEAALYGDEIEFDANPAFIIYECLTNTDWGMGAAASQIDTAAFEAAAATLWEDDFGLSMMWVQQASIEDFIREVLDHIEAVLYISPSTGKLVLKLIRDDYDEGSLPEINQDNARLTNWQRKAQGELITEVAVTWTNPRNEQEEVVYAQDNAGIAVNGLVSDGRNYYGVRSRALAQKLAHRDLRAASMPLASCEIELDRSFWDLVPGDCVKVDTPEDGISQIIMRVMSVDYGKPGDPAIKVRLVEDVFGKPIQEYDDAPTSEWVDPVPDPVDATSVQVLTLPYLFQELQVAGDYEYPEAFGAVLAASSTSGISAYQLYELETDYEPVAAYDYSTLRRGLLATALVPAVTSTITGLTSQTDGPQIKAGSWLFIGSGTDADLEIADVTAWDGTTATVKRGTLDTVPKAWPIGTPVWVMNAQAIADPTIRSDTEAVSYKVLTRTGSGLLPVGSATAYPFTLTERPSAPYRPADVKVNGDNGFAGAVTAYDDSPPDVVLTFSIRNRLTEDTTVLEWDDAGVAGEAGQTCVVEMYDDDTDTLLETYTGVTSPYTVPSGDYSGVTTIRLKVLAERDSIRSIQGYEIRVQVAEFNRLSLETGDNLLLETGFDLLREG